MICYLKFCIFCNPITDTGNPKLLTRCCQIKPDKSLIGSNIKQSKRQVWPADPFLFQRLPNRRHINTRTCLPPAAPEEVAYVPEPPVCISGNKAPWHQIPCTHSLCSIPFDGLTPNIQIFSNSLSFLRSFANVFTLNFKYYFQTARLSTDYPC